MESVLLVLGQVHVTAFSNQEEDIGEEDQVILQLLFSVLILVKKFPFI